jgi:putative endonuclease
MSRSKGNIAEDIACEFLVKNQHEIIDRNFYTKFGEIDIITCKDDTLHFIEVKSSSNYESAINNITASKLNKIIKSLHVYMKKSNYQKEFQVDALIVVDKECEFIENITM